MTFFYKVVGAVSAVGGCCAVTVPLSLNAGGLSGGGRTIAFKRCEDSEGKEEIQLNDRSVQKVCWKATQSPDEDDDQDQEESTSSESMTDKSKDELLNTELSTIWSKSVDSWKQENNGAWKSNCIDSTKGWKVETQSQETVKGYCENNLDSGNNSSNLSFLALSSEDSQSLRVCVNGTNCWTGDYDPEKVNTFSTRSRDDWYDLKFFKE